MASVAQNVREDPAFKQAQKRFFQNDVSDTASQYNAAASKFFDGGNAGKVNAGNTIGEKFQGVQQSIVPTDGDRFKRDKAVFFAGEEAPPAKDPARSTGSIYKANQAAFYGEDAPQPGYKIEASKAAPKPSNVNTKSGVYRKDAAGFFGDDKFEVESQGTQFQQNAAAFMGTDMPGSGERPFKMDKNAQGSNAYNKVKGNSYLNE